MRVTCEALKDLIKTVLSCTDKGEPQLSFVHLRTSTTHLIADGTDRYRIMRATAPIAIDEEGFGETFDVIIDYGALDALHKTLTAFKIGRDEPVFISLISEAKLRVFAGGLDYSIDATTGDDEDSARRLFGSIERFFDNSIEHGEMPAGFRTNFLAALPARKARNVDNFVVIASQGVGKPVHLFDQEKRWRMVVMPVRSQGDGKASAEEVADGLNLDWKEMES